MFAIEQIQIERNQNPEEQVEALIAAQSHNHRPYRHLDSGAFASVYGAKGSPIVYKTGDASSNEAYLAYVRELSRLSKHNPWLPRVYGCRIYSNGRDKHFVVALERLDQGQDRRFYDAVSELNDLCYNRPATRSALGLKRIVPRELKTALDLIKRARRKSRSGWDIHSGNLMLRAAKQLVITDPLA